MRLMISLKDMRSLQRKMNLEHYRKNTANCKQQQRQKSLSISLFLSLSINTNKKFFHSPPSHHHHPSLIYFSAIPKTTNILIAQLRLNTNNLLLAWQQISNTGTMNESACF